MTGQQAAKSTSSSKRRARSSMLPAARHALAACWVTLLALILGILANSRSEAASPACVAKQPGPPSNVTAVGRDSKLVLMWAPPTDGSCVSTYVINVLDPSLNTTIPVQTSSTSSTNTTIQGLQNGSPYNVTIQAYSDSFQGGGTSAVTATPTAACDKSLAPAAPLGLRVQAANGMAQVCWDGVTNTACTDSYLVSAVKVSDANLRSSSNGQLATGACANLTGLQNGVPYLFSVTPVSNATGAGSMATVQATVGPSASSGLDAGGPAGWTCVPINGCRPGSATYCAISGCQAVYKLGGCKGPFMFDVDDTSKQVSQWCGEVCPCDLSMATVFSPFSWGFQTLNTVFGGAQPGTPSLSSDVATALAPTNPALSQIISKASQITDVTQGATLSPTPGGAPYAGGGAIATVLQKTMQSGQVGNVAGTLTGAVSGAVANTAISGSVNALSSFGNAAYQNTLSAFKSSICSAGLPCPTPLTPVGVGSGTAASMFSKAAGTLGSEAGQVAGAVTQAVTTNLVSNTVNGAINAGANYLTNALAARAPGATGAAPASAPSTGYVTASDGYGY